MWLTSSTQPISTMRSPVSGREAGGFGIEDDFAVHQVFRALSAATSSPTAARVSSIEPLVSITYVGPLRLFGLRHLPGKDRVELFHGHARPRKARRALLVGIDHGDDHAIEPVVEAGLEEQRNIHNRERRACGLRPRRGTRPCACGPADGPAASSSFSRSGWPTSCAASAARSIAPLWLTPGKSASTTGTASPA